MVNMQPPQQGMLLAQVKRGASWFYWIAGFSVLRAFLNNSSHSASISFYSMGFTNILSTTSVGLVVSLIICGLWVLFGVFAGQGKKWAFITGIVLYALDALLLLGLAILGGDVFAYAAVAFHGYIVYRLVIGAQACNQLSALSAQGAAYGMPQAGYYGAPQQPGSWPPPPGAPGPQFGSNPNMPPPGAYPPPQAYPGQQPQQPPAGYAGYQPQPPQNLDGSTSTAEPAPAPPQALPSHWPAPAQPAQPRTPPES